jgi:uncharacterized repeat protein (TIGR01451 family)
VEKTGPATITAGQNATFIITVTNNGPATAPSVTLTDILPAGLIAPVSYTLNGTPMGNWPAGNLLTFTEMIVGAAGAQTIIITGKVDCAAEDFINTATVAVSWPFTDPDLSNNTSSVTTTIINPLAVTAAVTDSECPGDGEINITVTGGTPEYSYAWTGPSGFTGTDEDLTGLASGTYTVVVTDANGCTTTGSWEVTSEDTEPPTFTLPILATGYCVEGFIEAIFNPGGAYYVNDLFFTDMSTPARRDYFILNPIELLDLTGVSDNCPGPVNISWNIDFGNNGSTDLSGTGQISLATPIYFPLGDNLITWTITDSNGNYGTGTTILRVLPRPEILD